MREDRLLEFVIVVALALAIGGMLADPADAKTKKHHHHHPKGGAAPVVYVGSGGDPLVSYGDSITAGYGTYLPYPSLLTHYHEQDTGEKYTLYNNGVNGYWSPLLVTLMQSPQARSGNALSRFVTISIGFNDMSVAKVYYVQRTCGGSDGEQCYRDIVAQFKKNWDTILDEITSSCMPGKTNIAVATQYEALVTETKNTYSNPLQPGVSDHVVHKKYLEQMNAYITSTATARGIPVADLHTLFNGPSHDDPIPAHWLYDGSHPNMYGDVEIANLFRSLPTAPNC